jgi:hypothetical protein
MYRYSVSCKLCLLARLVVTKEDKLCILKMELWYRRGLAVEISSYFVIRAAVSATKIWFSCFVYHLQKIYSSLQFFALKVLLQVFFFSFLLILALALPTFHFLHCNRYRVSLLIIFKNFLLRLQNFCSCACSKNMRKYCSPTYKQSTEK